VSVDGTESRQRGNGGNESAGGTAWVYGWDGRGLGKIDVKLWARDGTVGGKAELKEMCTIRYQGVDGM
jgi:hypothetical protein